MPEPVIGPGRATADIHNFVTATLWVKLQDDIRDLRVFNQRDLVACAYFHIRRFLLIQPGWSCRTDLELTARDGLAAPRPDLTVLSAGNFQFAVRLEFHLAPGAAVGFPSSQMNDRMTALRRTVTAAEAIHRSGPAGRSGRGYLVGVFDTEEEWFYPDREVWENQSCFWLPINCRKMAGYPEWRQKWDRQAQITA